MLGTKVPCRVTYFGTHRAVGSFRFRRVLRALGLPVALIAITASESAAYAQSTTAPTGSETLSASIRRLARERRIEILFAPKLLAGKVVRPPSFSGPLDLIFSRMLEGTGIVARRTPDGTYYLGKAGHEQFPKSVAPSPTGPSRPAASLPEELDQPPIVVTARKRDELLVATPVAITAFSASQIAEKGARKLEDLLPFAPGVYFSQQGFLRPGRVEANVRIRGMSVNIGTPQEQLATVFVDGVPASDGVQSLSFEDIERVEVINGPQSAIFGRSTFGGAINLITRQPGEHPAAKSDVLIMVNGDLDMNASLEGPLIPGRLTGGVSGRILRVGGDYRNPLSPDQRLGRQASTSIGAALRLTLTDFSAFGRIRYSHDDDGLPAGWALGVAEANCGPFDGGIRGTICGNLPDFDQARFGQNSDDAASVRDLLIRGGVHNPRSKYGMDRETWSTSLNLVWLIPAANMRIEANGGFNRRRRSILSDSDLGPDRVTIAYYPMRSSDFSLELRARSQSASRFNWSLGAAYFDQKYRETVEGVYGARVLPSSYNPACTVAPVNCEPSTLRPDATDLYLGTLPYFIGHVKTKALFSSAELEMTSTLRASAELRGEWDRVEDPTLPNQMLAKDFSALLYRAVLSAHPSDKGMIYLSLSNGNLPGRFNASVIGASASTRQKLAAAGARDNLPQQSLQNLEAGLKFRSDEALLSVAAYRMRWRNQRFRQTYFDTDTSRTVSYLNGQGSSILHGIEVQGRLQPARWLTLGITADVADTRYTRQSSLVALRVLGDSDVSGNWLPGSPRVSGTMSGMISGSLRGDRRWHVAVDALFRGRQYVDELNLTTLPPVVTINARAGIKSQQFGLEVFATNIFQSQVPRSASAQTDISAYVRAFDFTFPGFVTEAPPTRKVGIKLSSVF